jgi:multidrug efflux system outer membrane protein
MIRTLAACAALASLLGGCGTLRPEYARPEAPVPAAWSAAGSGQAAVPADALGWRDVFPDPRLSTLVAAALDGNRDLRVAIATIRKARAGFEAQRAELLPVLGAGGAGNLGETAAGSSRQLGLSLGSSAYELDLFGRARDLTDAAFEEYLATAEARRTVQIGLVADVANAFYGLAADRERLALARDTLASQQSALGLIRSTVDAGSSSDLALAQARTSVETARGDVAAFTTAVAKGEAALALLVGAPNPVAVPRLSAVRPPAAVPSGLSSEVLLRRPDVLEAERRLLAAEADIGAARAAFFPSVTLTASAGLSSRALGGLFAAGSGVWAFAPQVNLPIFDGGRLQAGLSAARADRDIAVARYERAIQSGFREVSDSLAERATVGARISAQEGLVSAAARSHELALARFREGVDSYLAVLDAQRLLYAARQGLITVRLSRMTNLAVLYKALGGGWREGGPRMARRT